MRNKIKSIAFDADDTLWINMSLYHEAVEKILEILGKHIELTSIPQDFYKIESKNVPILGYGTKSFIISMIEAAISCSSQMISSIEIQKIILIGKELINSPVELIDNVENVIKELSEASLKMMLITKGDLFEQQNKINRSGLKEYFDHIEIVNEKDESTYASILQNKNMVAENFMMVGNSLKSDILPVMNIGGNAVYIPHKDGWYYEDIPIGENENKYYQIDKIEELPILLDRIY